MSVKPGQGVSLLFPIKPAFNWSKMQLFYINISNKYKGLALTCGGLFT